MSEFHIEPPTSRAINIVKIPNISAPRCKQGLINKQSISINLSLSLPISPPPSLCVCLRARARVCVCVERAEHADLTVEAGLKFKIMMEHTRMSARHSSTPHTYARTQTTHESHSHHVRVCVIQDSQT